MSLDLLLFCRKKQRVEKTLQDEVERRCFGISKEHRTCKKNCKGRSLGKFPLVYPFVRSNMTLVGDGGAFWVWEIPLKATTYPKLLERLAVSDNRLSFLCFIFQNKMHPRQHPKIDSSGMLWVGSTHHKVKRHYVIHITVRLHLQRKNGGLTSPTKKMAWLIYCKSADHQQESPPKNSLTSLFISNQPGYFFMFSHHQPFPTHETTKKATGEKKNTSPGNTWIFAGGEAFGAGAA